MQLKTDPDEDLDEETTVKLRIPKRQRLRLHCLKILSGDTMSEIAQEALDDYFTGEEFPDEFPQE